MPFTKLPGTLKVTRGTKTVVVEHVRHERGQFSGPQRPEDTYYTVTGTDTETPSSIYLPPAVLTLEEATALAYRWLDGKPHNVTDPR